MEFLSSSHYKPILAVKLSNLCQMVSFRFISHPHLIKCKIIPTSGHISLSFMTVYCHSLLFTGSNDKLITCLYHPAREMHITWPLTTFELERYTNSWKCIKFPTSDSLSWAFQWREPYMYICLIRSVIATGQSLVWLWTWSVTTRTDHLRLQWDYRMYFEH